MKATICKLLLLVNLLPFTAVSQTDVDAQIKRVERGLLPPVLIKGDPSWSIEERMKHWKAPGVSIAVVKDFSRQVLASLSISAATQSTSDTTAPTKGSGRC